VVGVALGHTSDVTHVRTNPHRDRVAVTADREQQKLTFLEADDHPYGMDSRSRRAFLAAVGSVSVPATAGCLFDGDSVSVLAAGSLAAVLDELGDRFSATANLAYHGEYHGSNAVIRMIQDRTKAPDVVVSADVDLLREGLVSAYTSWEVVFAGNELGITYNPQTALGSALEAGEQPWYELLRTAPGGSIAISDPDLDPLGYRSLQCLELAEAYYGVSGLRAEITERARHPVDAPRLLADVEIGNRAAAFAYRNMAVDRDLPFVELPPELNFADPSYADHYAQATYTTEDGYTATGAAILYSTSVLDGADNPDAGREFVGFLLDQPGALRERGLTVPASVPRATGDVPALPTEARLGGVS